MNTETYATEFPTFVLDVEIPENWIDTSWHNDTCPSWQCGDRKVYVEFADPLDRELIGQAYGRFIIAEYRGEGPHDDYWAELYQGDDWAEVLRLMQAAA